jgi:Tfp pilus assembly protein PilO
MDAQTIINIVAGAVLTVLGWFGRELWGAIKELQRDMREIEINLPNNYVKKEDFSKNLSDIKDLCDKIFEKLDKLNDKKADK